MNHSSRFLAAFLVLVLLLSLFLYSCTSSDDDPKTNPSATDAGSDSSSSSSGSSSGTTTPSEDSGPPPIRCTAEELAANDRTVDGGTFQITFSTGANPSQYGNRCVTVKVGASVTFAGSFTQHPLQSAGGDSPNPIPFTDQGGGPLTITMPTAGTFGFECAFHPKLMFGAIKVVP
jgi:plastocyanin